jgi:glycerophosphoryl diester phosphodiesterase
MWINSFKRSHIASLIFALGLFLLLPSFVSAATKVSPVGTLQAQKVNGTQIRLKWAGAKNCDGFIIYRKEKGKYKVVAKIKGKKTKSYTDKTVNANYGQTYAIKAYRKVKGKTVTSKAKGAWSPGYDRTAYVAHRGDMEVAPENTMAAFQRAFDNGYKVFECDVWYTDSGELLISHSNDLKATCGVEGKIYSVNSTTRYNYPIRVKNYKNYPDQYFPTIQEVLAFASRTGMKVLFHFRFPNGYISNAPHPARAISLTANLVKQAGMVSNVIIISSVPSDLSRFAKLGLTTGYVSNTVNPTEMMKAVSIAKKSNAKWALFPYSTGGPLSKSFIKLCHDNGIKAMNYNIASPAVVRVLIKNGCDAWVVNKTIFVE